VYKDYDLKNDPHYHSGNLRGRIQKAIKQLRDDTEEVKRPSAKKLPIIPVTGSGKAHKYTENKSWKKNF
jgi:hypothetical protein